MRVVAVDIGSNAVRLLLGNVIENQSYFKKRSFLRMPLRLGDDVFVNGFISEEKQNQLIKVIGAYSKIIEVYGPQKYRLCATSSLRESSNAVQLIDAIKKTSGLQVEIIDDNQEALINVNNLIKSLKEDVRKYLVADLGGGSMKLSFIEHGEVLSQASFKVGSIRQLCGAMETAEYDRMFDFIRSEVVLKAPEMIVGSGGSIVKLHKLSNAGKYTGQYLDRSRLQDLYDDLSAMTYQERIDKYFLNNDRADVIVPAGKTFLDLLDACKCSTIFVPKMGLIDGIAYSLCGCESGVMG